MTRAGFADIGITPPVGVDLVGYRRPVPSDGVLDPLSAVAGVFESSGVRVAILSMDSMGMLVPRVSRIRWQVADALEIPLSHVMVVFTHTHSGPNAFSGSSETYLLDLESRLVAVVEQARSRLRKCGVSWGVSSAEIGENRRQRGPDGKARMGHNPDGPVDERVGVLRVDDARSGSPLGLLVVCTAHANVLKEDNLKVSADFTGRARTRLREELGCPVLFAIGAAGDVNARWRGSVEDLERMSEGLCEPILRLLPKLRPAPLQRLGISSSSLRLNLLETSPD